MNFRKFLEVSEKYNDCPDCGSYMIGNGEGSIEVDEDVFKRTCKCGFRIKLIDGKKVDWDE